MKIEQAECSETLAYKIQTPGNYPEESTQVINCLSMPGGNQKHTTFQSINRRKVNPYSYKTL